MTCIFGPIMRPLSISRLIFEVGKRRDAAGGANCRDAKREVEPENCCPCLSTWRRAAMGKNMWLCMPTSPEDGVTFEIEHFVHSPGCWRQHLMTLT